ncbi:tRNA-uridine aminocarboxypropyltransferase [Gilvimarinus sp. 1_MG-2023]|uniref:tRNA-uridine aminocarboxypropyltransferase n=1 Tax=Gilvimarinus sp. 1_MG-2023 TaxID=3062638 RepID=UPI0026E4232B|nr:tRNA-uridine aminocarboxypropyltransferase [Gilvimarinus sp. 1_MG-2023]MDO6747760.1 tRNA-uridine aminocarboxypropyltransferase [Gilvimarinus sp. 1_MG-2023]
MIITLLTHATELHKPSNTGVITHRRLSNFPEAQCHRVIWQRKQPDPALLQRLGALSSGLLYPSPTAIPLTNHSALELPEHLVLIDSTWQQARKIVNHSPYLQSLPAYSLNTDTPSRFTLRRNQVAGGLCTLETVTELARLQKLPQLAEALERDLDQLLAQAHHGR